MAEETKPKAKAKTAKAKKPKLEDKPFVEFIQEHFIPGLQKAFTSQGIGDMKLAFSQEKLGEEECWQVMGNWPKGDRQFNLYFLEESIQGKKAFSCATNGGKPSTIESFMIDERRVTLDLIVLYTLQRLNGQKWLARN
ncbi:MAG: DUF2996 domain-containing protein [Prochloron sp. SP5CPC1]|nr:DUF2996 domain-containing protein [Candidatus Paraprochloron terpiosi SP5CPC1]